MGVALTLLRFHAGAVARRDDAQASRDAAAGEARMADLAAQAQHVAAGLNLPWPGDTQKAGEDTRAPSEPTK